MADPVKVYDQPGVATAEQGLVVLDGPEGVVATFTPAAARATADSLRQAADEADGRS